MAGAAFDSTGDRLIFAAGSTAELFDLRTGETVTSWDLGYGLSHQLRFEGNDRWLLLRREPLPANHNQRMWCLYDLVPGHAAVPKPRQTDTNWPAYGTALPLNGDKFLVWSGGWQPGPRDVEVRSIADGRVLWKTNTLATNGSPGVMVDAGGQWFACWTEFNRLGIDRFSLDNFHRLSLSPGTYDDPSASGEHFHSKEWLIRPLPPTGNGIPLSSEWRRTVGEFSPDGRYLAWGSQRGTVFIANLPKVKEKIEELFP